MNQISYSKKPQITEKSLQNDFVSGESYSTGYSKYGEIEILFAKLPKLNLLMIFLNNVYPNY